jgi:hypothetical protein
MELTSPQIEQLQQKGISREQLFKQIDRFKKGIPPVILERAATINDGIRTIENQSTYVARFEERVDDIKVVKFIPASGAATRMFKFLHQFVNSYNPQEESINSYINKNNAKDLFTFFIGLEKFPFYTEVIEILKSKFPDWHAMPDREKKLNFVKVLLGEDGLNYGHMPKGLVPFHRYKDHTATAFEEHLFEASIYAASNKHAHLHFTIAPAFEGHFNAEFDRIEKIVEQKTGTEFTIDFSYQKPSTDTVAVRMNNEPVLTEDGLLFFRPAGHGALLSNLNDIQADVIFIKNVDNVTVSSLEQEVSYYKKLLAGYLLELQDKCYEYLKVIDDNQLTDEVQKEAEDFLLNEIGARFPTDYHKYATHHQVGYIHDRLNRPLRICGMVKNEGEPGGGPFWLINQRGERTLEIVESAQIDTQDPDQVYIFKNGTHFNPVDIVCGVTNYKGEKFDLLKYSDPDSGFITHKSYKGAEIKAQENPGLWNGGMAFWNTVFVEVPLLTFNPVKTVNDLLKHAHQTGVE